jgi:hypothetical protein
MLRDVVGSVVNPWTFALFLVVYLGVIYWITARQIPSTKDPILLGVSTDSDKEVKQLKRLRQNAWEEFMKDSARLLLLSLILAGSTAILTCLSTPNLANFTSFSLIFFSVALAFFVSVEVLVSLYVYARYLGGKRSLPNTTTPGA